jgi:uncharacterized repeat protein (TIGR03803 family)
MGGGGSSPQGTIFELAHGNILSSLATFTAPGGVVPEAGLVLDSHGNLFGTTANGGSDLEGTIFKLAHGSTTITTLAPFLDDGANPETGVVMDSHGNLFGTTSFGGANGAGTVFEVVAGSGTVTTLASFNGVDGANPFGDLIIDSSGNLFGTAFAGGANNAGTIFEVAAGSTTITTLASFNGTDGSGPQAALVMDGSGNLYGTASGGGADGNGTVFKLAHGSTTITTLASFDGTDGSLPLSALVLDGSGNLFGTAALGGPTGNGTIFELAKGSSAVTTLASFNGTDGANPAAGVLMDGSGNLFGTTVNGGAFGLGTIFEVAAGSGTITTLASFDGTDGANPFVSPIMDSRGDLYGTTFGGGAFGAGTVFELPAGSGTIVTLATFDGTNGANTYSDLLLDSNNNLYGTTVTAGPGALGTVFELPGAASPTDQWTGANSAVDTNWSDDANWSIGSAPYPTQTVVFTNNATVKSFTSTVDAGFTNPVLNVNVDGTWGGTINVTSPLSVTGNLSLASGSFGGSGTVTIAGTGSQWTGGQIVVGSGGFVNAGTLNADTTTGSLVLTGAGTLTNIGRITEAGTHSLALESGATLDNAAGATLDFTNNGGVSQSGGGTLMNEGTLEKTGGTSTSTIASSFINNSGAITVQTGILALANAGGTSTGGTFNVSNGATLNLTGGAKVAYTGAYTGTGLGTVALSAGTLIVGTGGASFNMAGNLFQWTGGTIDVTQGTFTNEGTITYAGAHNVVLAGVGTMINNQQFIQTSTGKLMLENGTVLENATTGTYLIESNGGVGESGGGILVNVGTLEKSQGTGTSTIASSALTNEGTVAVASGTLAISAPVAQVTGKTLTAGTWTASGSATVSATLTITSAGSLTTIGSKAKVTLSGLNTAFTNLSGLTTIDKGGSFSLLGGQSFTTAAALTDKGGLVLGAGSVLTVSGSFTQTSTGALTIDMGGTHTAPTIGQLVSTTGTVTLAGSLTVTSTVLPAVGSSFEILDNEGNSALSGTFAGLPEGATFKVKVGSKTMTFQITYAGTDTDGGNNVVITRTA